MLFSDITDCEMLVYRCIQESDGEISLVHIMEKLEARYQRDWKRSTVCTFIAHLVEKGYVNVRREGRIFFYSSAINDQKFYEEQVRQFMQFWFDGSLCALIEAGCAVKGISKESADKIIASVEEIEEQG